MTETMKKDESLALHLQVVACRVVNKSVEASHPKAHCDCGVSDISMSDGCSTCLNCGTSKCEI